MVGGLEGVPTEHISPLEVVLRTDIHIQYFLDTEFGVLKLHHDLVLLVQGKNAADVEMPTYWV